MTELKKPTAFAEADFISLQSQRSQTDLLNGQSSLQPLKVFAEPEFQAAQF